MIQVGFGAARACRRLEYWHAAGRSKVMGEKAYSLSCIYEHAPLESPNTTTSASWSSMLTVINEWNLFQNHYNLWFLYMYGGSCFLFCERLFGYF
jgi:hypothetical protein